MRVVASSLVLFTLTSACSTPGVELRAGYAQIGARGSVGLEASDDPQLAQIDVEDELGLGSSGAPYAAVAVNGDLGRLGLSGFRFEDSGTGVLSRSFGVIGAGTVVESELTFQNLKAAWTFDLLDLGPVRFGPGVGADWFDIDTRVRSVTAVSAFERIQVNAPVPMLFVRGEAELGPVGVELELGGMQIAAGDLDGTFWDLDARVVFTPADGVELFAGYRRIDIESAGQTDESQRYDADIVVEGWMLGAGIRF